VRFPFKVKVIFGIGPVAAPKEQASPLRQLYIASAFEQTALFWGTRRGTAPDVSKLN
jgi:hypothetical protein